MKKMWLYTHNGIPLSHKERMKLATCDSVGRPQGHCVKWKKSNREIKILYGLPHTRNLNNNNKTHKLINTENKLVVARGRMGVGCERWVNCFCFIFFSLNKLKKKKKNKQSQNCSLLGSKEIWLELRLIPICSDRPSQCHWKRGRPDRSVYLVLSATYKSCGSLEGTSPVLESTCVCGAECVKVRVWVRVWACASVKGEKESLLE